jgi:integrase
MSDQSQDKALVPVETPAIRNKNSEVSAIRRAEAGAADYVPHLNPADIRLIITVAAQQKRNGERNSLLIKTLFDACLRCSEGISVCPSDIVRDGNGWSVSILGKGSKAGKVAISPSLASDIQSYCYRYKIPENDRIFPISRSQCYRIVCNAFDSAGVRRPTKKNDRVGAVHILRHSGAIERLRQTGNPKAVQDQLRHKSALMTLRYLKTLSADESLKVQQGVDFRW